MANMLFLLLGLALLVAGGDYLVKGGIKLSLGMNISPLIIGLTVLAFGTSAPELIVSIMAALEGAPDLAVGNVIGSNVANIWLVLGGAALIAPLCCQQFGLPQNNFFMLVITMIFMLMCFLAPLTVWHGLLLLGLLGIFLFKCFQRAKEKDDPSLLLGEEADEILEEAGGGKISLKSGIIYTLLGLIGLGIGSELTVNNAMAIAQAYGVSQAVIGITIVAIGTSLPELIAACASAWHGQPGLAIGNAVGSNIFNIAAVLGITSLVAPINIAQSFVQFDIWIMLAASLCLLPFMISKKPICRLSGLVFLIFYGLYLAKTAQFI